MNCYVLWVKRFGRSVHISYYVCEQDAIAARDAFLASRSGAGCKAQVWRLRTADERAAGLMSEKIGGGA